MPEPATAVAVGPVPSRSSLADPARLERLQAALVAATAAACSVSIFAAQSLLLVTVLVAVARLAVGRSRPLPLPLAAPILAYTVWTLLSASFSPDPVASHEESKKLVLFVLLYLGVDSVIDRSARECVLESALLGGTALAGGMLLQYYFLGRDTLNSRPSGSLGHYMTASGLVMCAVILGVARLGALRRRPAADRAAWRLLVYVGLGLVAVAASEASELFVVETERVAIALLVVVAIGRSLGLVSWGGPHFGVWLALVAVPLAGWALLVSRTRSAWIGAFVGLVVLLTRQQPRRLKWLAVIGAVVLAVRPAPVVERLTLSDASSLDRYYMWQAGIDMVLDRPIFGQGPGMILEAYPRYRWRDAPNPDTPHLHSNFFQIAAERGVPALFWFAWLSVGAALVALKTTRSDGENGPEWPAHAALGVLSALIIGGLFEYNFGDSEILMYTLVLMAVPFGIELETQA